MNWVSYLSILYKNKSQEFFINWRSMMVIINQNFISFRPKARKINLFQYFLYPNLADTPTAFQSTKVNMMKPLLYDSALSLTKLKMFLLSLRICIRCFSFKRTNHSLFFYINIPLFEKMMSYSLKTAAHPLFL